MPPGGAICPHPQPPWLQRNVVKHDDDILRRDFEEGGQLQYRPPGQVHIGLWLQQKQLAAVVIRLVVQPLKFQFVHFHAQLLGENVQRPKAAVVAGALIFFSGIAQAHNEPAFGFVFLKHRRCPPVRIKYIILPIIPRKTWKTQYEFETKNQGKEADFLSVKRNFV